MAIEPSTSTRQGRVGRRLQQRNARVQAHLALVAPIASHYARRSPEATEDLDQVGRLGLIRAAELYDSRQTVPFSAYARRHVRGAILHYLRDTAPLVREPRRLQEQRQRLREQEARLTAALGRRPSNDELRQSLALADRQWRELAQPTGGWQQSWLDERQDGRNVDSGEEELERQRAQRVRAALQSLDGQQRQVLEAVVLGGLSLRAVAARQGLSLTTTHRRLKQGLDQLRTRLTGSSAVPGC